MPMNNSSYNMFSSEQIRISSAQIFSPPEVLMRRVDRGAPRKYCNPEDFKEDELSPERDASPEVEHFQQLDFTDLLRETIE